MIERCRGGAEQMTGGTSVDEQVRIRCRTQGLPHFRQTGGELLGGKLELADQDAARRGDLEAGARRSRGQGTGEIRDED